MAEDCGCIRHQKVEKSTTGLIRLTDSFGGYLGCPCVRDRVAPLLLGGRQEDYLTKEFMQFVYWRSGGARFCEGNLGRRKEQRVDIAVLREPKEWEKDRSLSPEMRQGKVVEALIEAKYLQNRNRRDTTDSKLDEITPTLKDLARQLTLQPAARHSGSRVALRSRQARVYGLVFASYARRVSEPDAKKSFYARILKVADGLELRYLDLPKPYLRTVFEDWTIRVFDEDWVVSLRSALWRLKEVPTTRSTSPAGKPETEAEGN